MPRRPFSADSVGLFLAALGAALFATKGIFVKLALADGLDAVTVLTWRMLLATPVFIVFGWLGLRAHRSGKGKSGGQALGAKPVIQACAVGILGYYGASYLDFAGLTYTSAQLNRLILLTYPFLVLILGAVLFRRKLTWPMIGAALLAYSGIALIFARDLVVEGDGILIGAALVLGAALAYAFYQLFSKAIIDQLGAQLFTSIAMTAASAAVFIHYLCTHPISALATGPQTLAVLVGLALIATVLPVYMIAAAIGRIGAERTAVFGNISPVLTVVLAVWILGEAFTVYHGIGTALVICGILLFTRIARPKQAQVDAAA